MLASLVWGTLLYAQVTGQVNLEQTFGPDTPEPDTAEASATDDVVEDEAATNARARAQRRRRRRRLARRKAAAEEAAAEQASQEDQAAPTADATLGDPLEGLGLREVHAGQAGGEEQLQAREIEAGFDGIFPEITRCLMLAASDQPVRGRLTFGLRIAGSGNVEQVNLKGPAAITRGPAGKCLHTKAKALRFRAFDGPDMVVHYPVHLE